MSIGTEILIQRSDGRIHPAFISELRCQTRTVCVEWREHDEIKGKEIGVDMLTELNPDMASLCISCLAPFKDVHVVSKNEDDVDVHELADWTFSRNDEQQRCGGSAFEISEVTYKPVDQHSDQHLQQQQQQQHQRLQSESSVSSRNGPIRFRESRLDQEESSIKGSDIHLNTADSEGKQSAHRRSLMPSISNDEKIKRSVNNHSLSCNVLNSISSSELRDCTAAAGNESASCDATSSRNGAGRISEADTVSGYTDVLRPRMQSGSVNFQKNALNQENGVEAPDVVSYLKEQRSYSHSSCWQQTVSSSDLHKMRTRIMSPPTPRNGNGDAVKTSINNSTFIAVTSSKKSSCLKEIERIAQKRQERRALDKERRKQQQRNIEFFNNNNNNNNNNNEICSNHQTDFVSSSQARWSSFPASPRTGLHFDNAGCSIMPVSTGSSSSLYSINNNNNNSNNNNNNNNVNQEMSDFADMIKRYRTQQAMSYGQLRHHVTLSFSDPVKSSRITVSVRKRPIIINRELGKQELDIVTIHGKQTCIVHSPKEKVDLTRYLDNHKFCFDYAFDETANTELVYRFTVKPLVANVLAGGHAMCFAYGQTGSGKTFTMGGNMVKKRIDCSSGIYAMATQEIFQQIQAMRATASFSVFCSFFEIYCGKLYDLFNRKKQLNICEDLNGIVQVVNLKQEYVNTVDQLIKLIQYGMSFRTQGTTSANENSSRSHAVFRIGLKSNETGEDKGRISLIDLAGSERGRDTSFSHKITLMEGAEINKSLLALKECIRALANKADHIPFRGSTLTRVLRDSFVGENSMLSMIAMISPSHMNCEHTLNTLRYADRVKELDVELDGLKTDINNNNNNNSSSDNPAAEIVNYTEAHYTTDTASNIILDDVIEVTDGSEGDRAGQIQQSRNHGKGGFNVLPKHTERNTQNMPLLYPYSKASTRPSPLVSRRTTTAAVHQQPSCTSSSSSSSSSLFDKLHRAVTGSSSTARRNEMLPSTTTTTTTKTKHGALTSTTKHSSDKHPFRSRNPSTNKTLERRDDDAASREPNSEVHVSKRSSIAATKASSMKSSAWEGTRTRYEAEKCASFLVSSSQVAEASSNRANEIPNADASSATAKKKIVKCSDQTHVSTQQRSQHHLSTTSKMENEINTEHCDLVNSGERFVIALQQLLESSQVLDYNRSEYAESLHTIVSERIQALSTFRTKLTTFKQTLGKEDELSSNAGEMQSIRHSNSNAHLGELSDS